MRLTKSQLKQIVKEEIQKDNLEELNLPGSAFRSMQKALEKDQEKDLSPDVRIIANLPGMKQVTDLIKSRIDKQEEFMELISYFVNVIKMDPDKEIQLLRNLMTTMLANAKVAQEKDKKQPSDSKPKEPTQLELPLDDKTGTPAQLELPLDEKRQHQIKEIVREEVLKILLEEVKAGRLDEANMVKRIGDLVKRGIEKLTFKPTGYEKYNKNKKDKEDEITSDMEVIVKAFKRTKIEDLIRDRIDKPNEFSDIMLHMMSFVEDIPAERQAQYFRNFINKWQEKLEQKPKKTVKTTPAKKQ